MDMNKHLLFLLIVLSSLQGCAAEQEKAIVIGAEQTNQYLSLIGKKSVSLVVNQTSTIGRTHLVDSLLSLGVRINHIMAPEHGFRGDKDAGAHVKSGIDTQTNLPILSLYGKNKKPNATQLANTDLILFDVQDVGCRFYTYLSTLHYVMEACAENNIELVVLDRPNPNGHYVAGPVLASNISSFVGMHPIPIVHGCTLGELAQMINGEGWLKDKIKCNLKVVTCKNYTHATPYVLPIAPSPNLPNQQSILLYPSLCLFEPTQISIGRGTPTPFQIYGSPKGKGSFSFTPVSTPGASKYPKHQDNTCVGVNLQNINPPKFSLHYLHKEYAAYPNKKDFFTSESFFDKLAGTSSIREMLVAGKSLNEIEATWKDDLENYKVRRKKYLIYPEN